MIAPMRLVESPVRKPLRRPPKRGRLQPPSSPRFKPTPPEEAGQQFVIGGGAFVIGGQPTASKRTPSAELDTGTAS